MESVIAVEVLVHQEWAFQSNSYCKEARERIFVARDDT